MKNYTRLLILKGTNSQKPSYPAKNGPISQSLKWITWNFGVTFEFHNQLEVRENSYRNQLKDISEALEPVEEVNY